MARLIGGELDLQQEEIHDYKWIEVETVKQQNIECYEQIYKLIEPLSFTRSQANLKSRSRPQGSFDARMV